VGTIWYFSNFLKDEDIKSIITTKKDTKGLTTCSPFHPLYRGLLVELYRRLRVHITDTITSTTALSNLVRYCVNTNLSDIHIYQITYVDYTSWRKSQKSVQVKFPKTASDAVIQEHELLVSTAQQEAAEILTALDNTTRKATRHNKPLSETTPKYKRKLTKDLILDLTTKYCDSIDNIIYAMLELDQLRAIKIALRLEGIDAALGA